MHTKFSGKFMNRYGEGVGIFKCIL